MSGPPTTPHIPARLRSDRSPWHWLLLLPILAALSVPLYAGAEPRLAGVPLFYWFQVFVIVLGSVTCHVVHRATRKRTDPYRRILAQYLAEQRAAGRLEEQDGQPATPPVPGPAAAWPVFPAHGERGGNRPWA